MEGEVGLCIAGESLRVGVEDIPQSPQIPLTTKARQAGRRELEEQPGRAQPHRGTFLFAEQVAQRLNGQTREGLRSLDASLEYRPPRLDELGLELHVLSQPLSDGALHDAGAPGRG